MDNKQRACPNSLTGVYQKATVEVIRISDDDVIRTSVNGDKGETDFFE